VCDVGLLVQDGTVTYFWDVNEAIETYKKLNDV
jgi:hypothetical protein